MIKPALIFILGLAAGYVIHSQLVSGRTESLEQRLHESQKQTADLQAQIQSFKTHISELSADGTGKSAEEILSKIMQLFLVDLSIRLKAPETTSPVESSQSPTVATPAASHQQTDPAKAQDSLPEAPTKKLGTAMAQEIEKRITNARSEQEATDVLQQTRLENFFEIISQTKPMDQKSAVVLEGNFTGQTKPFDPSKKVVSVQMIVSLNSGSAGTSPQGKVQIVESKDGKVFSRSRGEGALKNFSQYEGSTMIVVEHNGGDNYFQLYYSTQGDFFVGNDYEKESASKYIPVGTIVLQRVR